MNKQQLAAKIWASAQKMRSSRIEAQQYKDYLLGFIFYKFLSSNEVNAFKKLQGNDFNEGSLKVLDETNNDLVNYLKDEIGYFIPYKHLYTTWLLMGSEFSVKNVTDALSSFSRNISQTHSHVFKDVFHALEGGFSSFGETTGSMTKAISELLGVIRDIPTDGQQGYDVLGFIYEYLISNFAASAGKKAGEYYTPHEVSVLMSEIVAEHLKDRDSITIYDPTSGSGSLLLTIGKAVAKHIEGRNRVDYYAQELVESTFNLTRMNLVMRQIPPTKIHVSNADTLAADWPLKETGECLRVDAVVSNPPYSQGWNPAAMKLNPRFDYGLAPKGKADYAFLLHSLYHLAPNGIMTIVLPTGVLSRGEEYEIRKNLIENEHIKAVIALPPNIFYGTNIPTIIMVLCQKRQKGEPGDVLFINATDCCMKSGKKNVLRASDIRRIADAVRDRQHIPHFAYLASKKEIAEKNDYNLHIPRYVSTADTTIPEDIRAHILGGIPDAELVALDKYWETFPSLRGSLFAHSDNAAYSQPTTSDVDVCIRNNVDVMAFCKQCAEAMNGLDKQLEDTLIARMKDIKPDVELTRLTSELFQRTAPLPLIDQYAAYQTFSDHWTTIANDLEIIQTEGFEAIRKIDAIKEIVTTKNGVDEEKTRGWQGRIIPFSLVQQTLLKEENDSLLATQQLLENMSVEYAEMRDQLTDEEQDRYLTEDRENFDFYQVEEDYRQALSDIETPDILTLKAYLALLNDHASKPEKQAFIAEYKDFDWSQMPQGRDGTYSISAVRSLLFTLQSQYVFDDNSTEGHIQRINQLRQKEKSLQTDVRLMTRELERHTIQTISLLTDEQAQELLRLKWIVPLCQELKAIPEAIIDQLSENVRLVQHKYADTLHQINDEIIEAENSLAEMLGKLRGSDEYMAAISELKAMMKGDRTGEGAQTLKEVCSILMIPTGKGNVPQVRFNGYEGEWEEDIIDNKFRILKNNTFPRAELNYTSGTVKNVHYGDVLIKYGSCLNIESEIVPYITKGDNAKRVMQSILKDNDVIVADTAEDETVGKCSEIINVGDEKIVSGLHTIPLRPKEAFAKGYMGYFMNTSSFHNQLVPYMQGSKVLAISRTSIKEVPVRFPASISEQHDIAKFFLTLDRLIFLRARQLEKLKALKTGFLQKMFV